MNPSYLSLLVLFSILAISFARIIEHSNQREEYSVHRTHHKHHICVNGVKVNGECQCTQDYAGKFCEKQKHCASYRRFSNGSCTDCQEGYDGDHCENLICVHGEVNSLGTECVCKAPYSGKHCAELKTHDVYSFYNNRVNNSLGPLGALILIPMCLCYFGCNKMASKRQVKRINNQLVYQNIDTNRKAVKYLLDNEVYDF